jgi:hypothetical protein
VRGLGEREEARIKGKGLGKGRWIGEREGARRKGRG